MSIAYGNLDLNLLKLVGKLRIVYVVYVYVVRIITATLNVLVVVIGIKCGKHDSVYVIANGTGGCCEAGGSLIKCGDYPLVIPCMTGTCLGLGIHIVTVSAGTDVNNVLGTVLRLGSNVCGKPLAPLVTGSCLYLVVNVTAVSALTLVNYICNAVADVCFVRKKGPIAICVAGTRSKCDLLLTASSTNGKISRGNLAGIYVNLNLNGIAICMSGTCAISDLILATYRAVTLLTVTELTGIKTKVCRLPSTPIMTGVGSVLGLGSAANLTNTGMTYCALTRILGRIGNLPLTPLVVGSGTCLGLNSAANGTGVSKEERQGTIGSNLGNYLLPLAEAMGSAGLNLIVFLTARRTGALKFGSYGTVSKASIGVGLLPLAPCMTGALVGLDLVLAACTTVTDLAIDIFTRIKTYVSRTPLAPLVAGANVGLGLVIVTYVAKTDLSIYILAVIKAAVSYPLTVGVTLGRSCLGLGISTFGTSARINKVILTVCISINQYPLAVSVAGCRNGLSIKGLAAIGANLSLSTGGGTAGLLGNLPFSIVLSNGTEGLYFLLTALTVTSHFTLIDTGRRKCNLPFAVGMFMLGIIFTRLTGCKNAHNCNNHSEQAYKFFHGFSP